MAKIKVVDLDVAFQPFGELAKDSEGIAKMCVYDGAGVLADAVKKNIQALPVRDKKQRGTEKHKVKGVTAEEKEALLSGFGIAHMRTGSGSVDTVLGFDGYTGKATKDYPKGKAIPMVARSVEKGTSWLQKTPFIKPAINQSQEKAQAAMAARFDEEIQKRGK